MAKRTKQTKHRNNRRRATPCPGVKPKHAAQDRPQKSIEQSRATSHRPGRKAQPKAAAMAGKALCRATAPQKRLAEAGAGPSAAVLRPAHLHQEQKPSAVGDAMVTAPPTCHQWKVASAEDGSAAVEVRAIGPGTPVRLSEGAAGPAASGNSSDSGAQRQRSQRAAGAERLGREGGRKRSSIGPLCRKAAPPRAPKHGRPTAPAAARPARRGGQVPCKEDPPQASDRAPLAPRACGSKRCPEAAAGQPAPVAGSQIGSPRYPKRQRVATVKAQALMEEEQAEAQQPVALSAVAGAAGAADGSPQPTRFAGPTNLPTQPACSAGFKRQQGLQPGNMLPVKIQPATSKETPATAFEQPVWIIGRHNVRKASKPCRAPVS